MNLEFSVDRDSNKYSHEKKTHFLTMTLPFKVRNAMLLIARYSFLFYGVAIRWNNELYRLIAPRQKETTTHAKHHLTEDFRMNCLTMT